MPREYARAMWLMLQEEQPGDYVIASGETHSVREFLESAFGLLDLDPYEHVTIDPDLIRPAEIDFLMGDCSKATTALGWTYDLPFEDLVKEMVDADLELGLPVRRGS